MGNGFEPSTTKTTDYGESSSNGGTNNDKNNNEIGDFECNICFDLAQDPIITLCGHLFCWPCLYKWLHYHPKSQECPVCKALVQEHKLVPLYGRGKSRSDPRTRPILGFEVPNRPTGQRPETAPPPISQRQRYLPNFGSGLFGGFMPMTTTRFGNITMSAGLGGILPGMMSFQYNGFPNSLVYGAPHGHGLQNGFPPFDHGGQNNQHNSSQRQDVLLKNLFVIIGFLVLLSFIFT